MIANVAEAAIYNAASSWSSWPQNPAHNPVWQLVDRAVLPVQDNKYCALHQRGSRRGALVALLAGPGLPTLATPGADAARAPCNDGDPRTTGDIGNFQGVCEGTPVTCPSGTICCPSGTYTGQCKAGAFGFCTSGIACRSGQ